MMKNDIEYFKQKWMDSKGLEKLSAELKDSDFNFCNRDNLLLLVLPKLFDQNLLVDLKLSGFEVGVCKNLSSMMVLEVMKNSLIFIPPNRVIELISGILHNTDNGHLNDELFVDPHIKICCEMGFPEIGVTPESIRKIIDNIKADTNFGNKRFPQYDNGWEEEASDRMRQSSSVHAKDIAPRNRSDLMASKLGPMESRETPEANFARKKVSQYFRVQLTS